MSTRHIPPPREDFLDPRTGKIATSWFRYLLKEAGHLDEIELQAAINSVYGAAVAAEADRKATEAALIASLPVPPPDVGPVGDEARIVALREAPQDWSREIEEARLQQRRSDAQLAELAKELHDVRLLATRALATFSAGGADHGELTGNADDDHTHYFLTSGARAATFVSTTALQATTNVSSATVSTATVYGTDLIGATRVSTATVSTASVYAPTLVSTAAISTNTLRAVTNVSSATVSTATVYGDDLIGATRVSTATVSTNAVYSGTLAATTNVSSATLSTLTVYGTDIIGATRVSTATASTANVYAGTLVSSVTVSTSTMYASGLISAAGGQVAFPATQNASADANTLDDYEEGTWTAAIQGSGTAGTYEILSQISSYTKIGRRVFLDCQIIMAGALTAGGTGYLQITGVPFAKAANNAPKGTVWLRGVDWAAGANLCISFISTAGSSVLYITETNDNAVDSDLQIAGIAANDRLSFSISYDA